MKKTLLHRLFGWGKLPKRYASILYGEGILLLDEGIGGSITLKKFQAPGRYHSWKKSWFTGSIVLTGQTFAAFALVKPLIYVPLDREHVSKLCCIIEKGDTLLVQYDASTFNETWSGTIACRFRTSKAQMFLERLQV
ncbi:MAG: hypothetical protein JXA89_28590 [Anaerolineae bacterium]|nr:hypothetical protein [Anaerolineae bacterium]